MREKEKKSFRRVNSAGPGLDPGSKEPLREGGGGKYGVPKSLPGRETMLRESALHALRGSPPPVGTSTPCFQDAESEVDAEIEGTCTISCWSCT